MMDKAGVRRYKERWQKVNVVTLREQLEASSETKLRQSTGLLQLARRLGWDLRPAEREIERVRMNWNRLRARQHERQS
jgi:hypothetical protein